MSEVAQRTRTYLEGRISFLKSQMETVSVQESTRRFELNSMITENEQTLKVLNGGDSIYSASALAKKVEEVEHA